MHNTRKLSIWLVLICVALLGRALMPALRKPSESRGLMAMVFLAATRPR